MKLSILALAATVLAAFPSSSAFPPSFAGKKSSADSSSDDQESPAFVAADDVEGSVRSPCPALNTLANHGFINRDGKNVDLDDLANALELVFRLDKMVIRNGPIQSAVDLGLTYEGNDGMQKIDIDALFRGFADEVSVPTGSGNTSSDEAQEHDGSFFRENGSREISSRLIDLFFDGPAFVSIEDINAFQNMRIKESCESEEREAVPRPWTGPMRGGHFTQSTLILIMGTSGLFNKQFDAKIKKSNILSFIEDEKLPDGYVPNEDILFSLGNTDCNVRKVRDAFGISHANAICEFCPQETWGTITCNDGTFPRDVNFPTGPLEECDEE